VPEDQLSLQRYLRTLRRQAWIVALMVALAIGAAALITSRQQSTYRSSMKVVVGQGGGVFQPEFSNATDTFTSTMTNLLRSDIVARTVISNLQLEQTPKSLLNHLKVSSKPLSSVLEVSFTSPSRTRSVTILREVGSVFTNLVRVKLGTVARTSPTTPGQVQVAPISASVFDPAHAEAGRVSPRPTRNIVIAGVLGLILGLVLAFVRESLDDRVRSSKDAEEWFGAPVAGTLPKGMRGQRPAPLTADDGRKQQHVLESLRMLSANLQFAHGGAAGPSILVTSAIPEEGKSSVVANLGAMLAQGGNDVVVVDADLRRPRLSNYLSATHQTGGLVDVLQGSTTLERVLTDVPLLSVPQNGRVPTRNPTRVGTRRPEPKRAGRLRLLGAGTATTASTALLTPEAVERLIKDLAELCEYVVFDAPPLLAVADSFPLALKSDTIIVVARQGRTTRQNAESVRDTLSGLGAKNVSVVVTDGASQAAYAYSYRPER
jgi:capsular polysaccharide biosynthesis protein/Mrp family chromosome partitioning ATPase